MTLPLRARRILAEACRALSRPALYVAVVAPSAVRCVAAALRRDDGDRDACAPAHRVDEFGADALRAERVRLARVSAADPTRSAATRGAAESAHARGGFGARVGRFANCTTGQQDQEK